MNWIITRRPKLMNKILPLFRWVPIGLFLIWPLVSSCAQTPDITGRWQEIGAQATLEFRPDGTFTAVDNQGMSVSGTYQLMGDGRARFDIAHPDGSPETIRGRVSLREEILSVISDGDGKGERYRRAP